MTALNTNTRSQCENREASYRIRLQILPVLCKVVFHAFRAVYNPAETCYNGSGSEYGHDGEKK